jgi:hypothetical protein
VKNTILKSGSIVHFWWLVVCIQPRARLLDILVTTAPPVAHGNSIAVSVFWG